MSDNQIVIISESKYSATLDVLRNENVNIVLFFKNQDILIGKQEDISYLCKWFDYTTILNQELDDFQIIQISKEDIFKLRLMFDENNIIKVSIDT